LIEPITASKLRQNLAWIEIRIIHCDNPSDFFARYLWDGRVFFINKWRFAPFRCRQVDRGPRQDAANLRHQLDGRSKSPEPF